MPDGTDLRSTAMAADYQTWRTPDFGSLRSPATSTRRHLPVDEVIAPGQADTRVAHPPKAVSSVLPA
jgi:hypothetical protein